MGGHRQSLNAIVYSKIQANGCGQLDNKNDSIFDNRLIC